MSEEPTNDDALSTYLSNHMIAAASGERLFAQAAKVWKDTDLGPTLSRLRAEIDEDKTSLESLADGLQLGMPAYKKPLAWASALLATVDPLNPVHSTKGASAQLELETLISAVSGKSLLWKTLITLSGHDERINRAQVEELLRRAESQRAELEALLQDSVGRRFAH